MTKHELTQLDQIIKALANMATKDDVKEINERLDVLDYKIDAVAEELIMDIRNVNARVTGLIDFMAPTFS